MPITVIYQGLTRDIFLLVILCILSIDTNAQKEDKIKAILETSDLKKTEKAEKLNNDADKCIEAANQLYMETFAVQGNTDLDEKTIKKKVKQLEENARQKIAEASSLYQKGNEILYSLYKSYIEKFWLGYQGEETTFQNARLIEEQSNDLYFQAVTSRTEAGKMPDGNEKVQKLTQAHEYEIEAVDKQLTTLGFLYNIDLSETQHEEGSPAEAYQAPEAQQPSVAQSIEEKKMIVEPLTETTVPGQVVINQSMIEMYNRYVASHDRPEDSLSTTGFANISSFDAERILQIWTAYIYGTGIEGQVEVQPTATAETEIVQPTAEVPSETQQQEQVPEEQIGVVDNERQAQQIPADENIIYRVQIAANKTELSQHTLQRMYYGNKSVEMIEEGGWFKYSVGDFATYNDANKFRKSSGVKNAFIVAYRKGIRFIPGVTGAPDKTTFALPPAGDKNMPAGIVFRIQVAASRAPLTKEVLGRIYGGHYSLEMIEEDGWYKYQFMGVRLYSDALSMLKDVQVKGSFISAYEDGIKINPYEGVKKNRELEKSAKASGHKNLHETEYHVQLAATKFPIKKEELERIYNGKEPIALILEEGWYKYRIKAGNSYALAKRIQAECGVEKAFIIPYKRARKINLFEAIRDTNP